jgi:hypothetical protein
VGEVVGRGRAGSPGSGGASPYLRRGFHPSPSGRKPGSKHLQTLCLLFGEAKRGALLTLPISTGNWQLTLTTLLIGLHSKTY